MGYDMTPIDKRGGNNNYGSGGYSGGGYDMTPIDKRGGNNNYGSGGYSGGGYDMTPIQNKSGGGYGSVGRTGQQLGFVGLTAIIAVIELILWAILLH